MKTRKILKNSQGILVRGCLLFSAAGGIEFGRLFDVPVDDDSDGLDVLNPDKVAQLAPIDKRSESTRFELGSADPPERCVA